MANNERSIWAEFPLKFGDYKFSANEAHEIAEGYRQREIAEYFAYNYEVENWKAMELADKVMDYMLDCSEAITEDEAIEAIAEGEALTAVWDKE